ncbi:MAG: IMP cyclohydrolase [Verrucomicrobiota bacterium]|nr:IMP cyclohydrolase [Verrucomicrobiota bacterium]
MPDKKLSRNTYLSKNKGDFSNEINFMGIKMTKVDDLRYGTNPHQPGAYYKIDGQTTPIGDMKLLKSGKGGLSQTNLEDISYAMNIVKFFDIPCCACMKHINPSGAAVEATGDSLKDVYVKARDCDPRAAFGSVVAFNRSVDAETANEIMSTFVECVVAPKFDQKALDIFNDNETYKFNKSMRVIQCGDLAQLPKYVGDDTGNSRTVKVLHDGTVIIAEPLLTNLRSIDDLTIAEGKNKRCGEVKSEVKATEQQIKDLLTAWYFNISVRSNGVLLVKNGGALAVGTGEQDRVGAVEQAIWKFEQKYKGKEKMDGAVMSSDGFFPFADAVEVAAKAGVKAVISPAGSLRDADVIKRANELGIALYHAPERIFSHH